MASHFQLPADTQARLSMLADLHRCKVGRSEKNGRAKALPNVVRNTATSVVRTVE